MLCCIIFFYNLTFKYIGLNSIREADLNDRPLPSEAVRRAELKGGPEISRDSFDAARSLEEGNFLVEVNELTLAGRGRDSAVDVKEEEPWSKKDAEAAAAIWREVGKIRDKML